MLVYGTQLVVLPFRKDTLTDEQEGGVGEGYACCQLYILLINVFQCLVGTCVPKPSQHHKCLHVDFPVGLKYNLV